MSDADYFATTEQHQHLVTMNALLVRVAELEQENERLREGRDAYERECRKAVRLSVRECEEARALAERYRQALDEIGVFAQQHWGADIYSYEEYGDIATACTNALSGDWASFDAALAAVPPPAAATPADEETKRCDGSASCSATRHVHGCYSDRGECDAPDEHVQRKAGRGQ